MLSDNIRHVAAQFAPFLGMGMTLPPAMVKTLYEVLMSHADEAEALEAAQVPAHARVTARACAGGNVVLLEERRRRPAPAPAPFDGGAA